MKKKENKLITNVVFPFIGIGSLILSAYIAYHTNLVPNLSLCNSYPNTLCETPYIRRLLQLLSLKFLALIVFYITMAGISFLIFYKLGLKDQFHHSANYKETEADKKKWNKYGLYAALIFVPVYALFLIFFTD